MKKVNLLLIFFLLLTIPQVSASVTNGDFETNSFSGWTVATTQDPYGGSYPAVISWTGSYRALLGYGSAISQTIDFTNVDELTVYARYWASSGQIDVYIDSTKIGTVTSAQSNPGTTFNIDVSGYSGQHVLKFQISANCEMILDDISAIATEPPISWDKSTYHSGDVANISYTYSNYMPSNENSIVIFSLNPAGSWQYETVRFLSAASGSVFYTVPDYPSRQFRADLMTRDPVIIGSTGTVLANATMQMSANGTTSAIDQQSYEKGQNMTITYENAPPGSYIQVTNPNDPTKFKQYPVNGNGSVEYQIPTDAKTGDTYCTTMYDANGNVLSTSCTTIININRGTTTMSGRVRSATTGATLSGATITVAGVSATSNSQGDYTITFQKGEWSTTISRTGYVDSVFNFNYINDAYSYNPALVPTSSATATTLSGQIRDAASGAGITGAMVTVSNSTFTKTVYSSIGGGYSVTGVTQGQNYTVSVKAEYYENYNEVFTHNATPLIIEMIHAQGGWTGPGGGGVTPTDPTGGSTTAPTLRPGRAAAQETMSELEGIVPNLIMMVVLFVFLAVIKKGAK
jgi:hypothetical protein